MTAVIEENTKTRVAEWICLYGHGPSIALLSPNCEIFQIPQIEGAIGFRIHNQCAISFGDPVCSRENIPILVDAFQQYCEEKNLIPIYAISSEEFKVWALNNICSASIGVGTEQIMNPFCQLSPVHDTGKASRSLRNKLQQALHEGVEVYEYVSTDEIIEEGIRNVGKKWLEKRQGPQIYLTSVDFFSDRTGRRWFYAIKDGQIIGTILLHQIEQGYVLNFLMAIPDAPHGTSESLVMFLLETLKKEECTHLSLGIVPAKDLNDIQGFGKFACWITQRAFKIAKYIFHIDRHGEYWKKFQPQPKPCYILFKQPKISFNEIIAIIRAFNSSL